MKSFFMTRHPLFVGLFSFTIIYLFMFCQYSYGAEEYVSFTSQQTGVLNKTLNNFLNASEEWTSKLSYSVTKLFKILFTLEVTMLGITALLKRQEIEDIILNMATAFLFGGFILLCINNYAEWSANIINGMAGFVDLTVGGGADIKNMIVSPLATGFDVFKLILGSLTGWKPIDSLGLLLAGFAILISFAFITLNVIYIKCEAAVAVGAGFILLGFGGCHFFKDYAVNMMRYILSVAFKLYVLHMVLGMGFVFIEKNLVLNAELNWEDLAVILVTALIILTLSKSLPDVAAGIINGAHVSTGGNLMSTTKQVMTMAAIATAGTAASAKGGYTGFDNLRQAVGVARGAGATGFGGVTKGAFDALRDARQQSVADQQGSTMRGKLEAMRQAQRLGTDPLAAPASPAQNPLSQAQNAKSKPDAQSVKPSGSNGDSNDVQKKDK